MLLMLPCYNGNIFLFAGNLLTANGLWNML